MKDFDLSRLDTAKGAEEGFHCELRDIETSKGLGLYVLVLGADSETYRDKMAELQRIRVNQMTKTRRVMPTAGELEAENLELLVTATKGWFAKNEAGEFVSCTIGGEPFSPAAARRLYSRFRWMREQIDEAIGDRANFLKASAAS